MFVGCVSYAISTSFFLAPNSIVAGGITGLSVIVNIINSRIPIGLISIVINVPFLALSIKKQGIWFVLKCLLTVAVLGVTTDILAGVTFITIPVTNNPVLASLYGGVCQGIGIGLFIRYQFSSGGTELMGRLIANKVRGLKINVCVGVLDAIIVLAGAIVTNSITNMLCALIVVFCSTKVSEIILVGFEKSKLCYIITDKGEDIAKVLIQQSPRGVTMLDGKGMYSNKEHNILMTCVKNNQLSQLKQIVKEIDETAFLIITDSNEVRGKGFKSLNEKN